MRTRLSAFCSVALLSTVANGQTLSRELCASVPRQIDAELADLPSGAEYVAFARHGASKSTELPRRTNVGEYFFLAGLLRLYGECNLQGILGDADPRAIRRYLQAAALLGDASANHVLASTLVFHPLDPDEPAIGVRMLQEEYDEGSAFAAGELGWAYHMGYGVPRDDEKAFGLYEDAAEHGMTLWQFLLAHVYEQGYYGRPVDAERAKYWKERPDKVQIYTYDCAVLSLYREGLSFPNRPELESRYAELCGR